MIRKYLTNSYSMQENIYYSILNCIQDTEVIHEEIPAPPQNLNDIIDDILDEIPSERNRLLFRDFFSNNDADTIALKYNITKDRVYSIVYDIIRKNLAHNPNVRELLVGRDSVYSLNKTEIGDIAYAKGLESRVRNELLRSGYRNFKDLKFVTRDEFLSIRNFGVGCLNKLVDYMLEHGYKLNNLDEKSYKKSCKYCISFSNNMFANIISDTVEEPIVVKIPLIYCPNCGGRIK